MATSSASDSCRNVSFLCRTRVLQRSLHSIATFFSTWDNLQVLRFSANGSHQRNNNTMFLLTPFYAFKRISLSPDSPSRAENILSSASSCYFPSPLKPFVNEQSPSQHMHLISYHPASIAPDQVTGHHGLLQSLPGILTHPLQQKE